MDQLKVTEKVMNLPSTKTTLSISKDGRFVIVKRTETTFFSINYLYKVLENFKGEDIKLRNYLKAPEGDTP